MSFQSEPVLALSFNQPMVLDPESEAASRFIPFEMSPPVNGRVEWAGRSHALFMPDAPLPFASAFEVRVPATTQSLYGRILKNDAVFKFSTPSPRLETVSFLESGRGILFLFNQPIDPMELTTYLKAEVNRFKGPLPFRARLALSGETLPPFNRAIVVEPSAKLAPREEIRFELSEKVKGTAGTATLGKTLHFKMTTPVPNEALGSVLVFSGALQNAETRTPLPHAASIGGDWPIPAYDAPQSAFPEGQRRIVGSTRTHRAEKIILPANMPLTGIAQISVSPFLLLWVEEEVGRLWNLNPLNLEQQIAQGTIPAFFPKLAFYFGHSELEARTRQDEVEASLGALSRFQAADGGFTPFPDAAFSSVELTARVLKYLARLKEIGYEIPAELVQKSEAYLSAQFSQPDFLNRPEAVGAALIALTAWDADNPAALPLLESLEKQWANLSVENRIRLLVAQEDWGREFPNRSRFLEEIVGLVSESDEGAALQSRETTAELLGLLLKVHPGHVIAPKLANWLARHAQASGPLNSSEAVSAIEALWQFHLIQEESPEGLKVMAQRGEKMLLNGEFPQKTNLITLSVELPVNQLKPSEMFVFQKEGIGNLYYRIRIPSNEPSVFETPDTLGLIRKLSKVGGGGLHSLKVGDKVKSEWVLVVSKDARSVVVEDPYLPEFSPDGWMGELGQNRASPLLPHISRWSATGQSRRVVAEKLPKGVYTWSAELEVKAPGEAIVPRAIAYELYNSSNFTVTKSLEVKIAP